MLILICILRIKNLYCIVLHGVVIVLILNSDLESKKEMRDDDDYYL